MPILGFTKKPRVIYMKMCNFGRIFLELRNFHQPSIKDVQVKQSEAIAEGFIAALK